MNKDQEIQAIRELASRLGESSYCGPWLQSIIPEIEREIRSDFRPIPTPDGARAACAARVAVVTLECEQRLAAAQKACDALLADARRRVLSEVHGATSALRKALQALEPLG